MSRSKRILFIVYDNASYISWFPQGLGYIAAILEKEGHTVEIYNQDLHHWPEEHLTNHLNTNYYDIVGLSIIAGYYQYQKLKKISSAVNNSRKRANFKYVIGGHMCSPDPKYFYKLTKADYIVEGEGELKIIEYINTGAPPLKNFEQIKDIDSIPFPAYHLFPIEHYRLLRMAHCEPTDFVMPVISGRGCTFKCSFCYRLMTGFRPRCAENIIEELTMLNRNYGINYFSFTDELLMSSVKRTTELCNAFLKMDFKFKWDCNGRLNYANPKLLELMKKAGCVFINYGIEAIDNHVLKSMNKCLTVKQIKDGIQATLKSGISPGFNIIWGNIGDDLGTLEKGVEFLLAYDNGSQMRTIRPVTPYPGCPLFEVAIKRGLCKDTEDFYENKHVNSDLLAINFTELSDDDFHKALFNANSILLKSYHTKKCKSFIDQSKKLYLDGNASFRGFR